MKSEHKVWAVALGLFLTGVILLGARCAKAEPVYVKGCSGTYIGSGYVLTAGHCLLHDDLFVAKANPDKDKPGFDTEKFTAKVVWIALGRDFGVVRLDKALVKKSKDEREDSDGKWKEEAIKAIPFKATKVSCSVPVIGQKHQMKGWPIGEYTEVTSTVASDPREIGAWEVAQFVSSSGFFGNSGSGMINDSGEVQGVMVGLLPGSALMVIVPTAEICNILPREIK